jgi:hypothetical protein
VAVVSRSVECVRVGPDVILMDFPFETEESESESFEFCLLRASLGFGMSASLERVRVQLCSFARDDWRTLELEDIV